VGRGGGHPWSYKTKKRNPTVESGRRKNFESKSSVPRVACNPLLKIQQVKRVEKKNEDGEPTSLFAGKKRQSELEGALGGTQKKVQLAQVPKASPVAIKKGNLGRRGGYDC